MNFRELLDRVVGGELSVEEAEQYLSSYGFIEIGYHRFDTQREHRTAVPEVVFGLGKTVEQLAEIIGRISENGRPLLVTKVDAAKAAELLALFPQLAHREQAQILMLGTSRHRVPGRVAILTAGSSDIPVAEEAAATMEFFGVETVRGYDCGVAGLHRLFALGGSLRDADVVIVVAGMDGALPSVVGGLVRAPIIAVPTSVGYGASFDGLAALLTMLNSCSAGITVVNIDNGFGAATAARSILSLAARRAGEGAARPTEPQEES